MSQPFKKAVILGVGLLGGSLGQALKQRKLASTVWGWGRDPKKLALARRLGALDRGTTSLAEACAGADLIVLATPITAFRGLLKEVSGLAPSSCLVTDVGSVKGSLVADWEKDSWPLTFVPSHPMAGSEKTGVAAARPSLFEGSVCITTPTPRTPRPALLRIEKLWKDVGATVVRLGAAEHDRKIGALSHLPHAAAFALVRAAARDIRGKDWGLAGNGFRDCTRVAASDAGLWADILLANRRSLSAAMKAYRGELESIERFLKSNDRGRLTAYLEKAARLRRLMNKA